MAILVANANGNFSTSATWALCDATFSTASTSSTATALTTSFQTSSATTPGAITVDALAVKVISRAAGTPTNNLILSLYNSTDGTETTSASIPVVDIPSCSAGAETHGGWFLWKFGAPITLTAGKNYVLRARLDSTSTAVSLNAIATTNWQRLLRTTTQQAPATGDFCHILGEWTGSATWTARTATIDFTTSTTDLGAGTTTGFAYVPAVTIGYQGTLNATTGSTVYLRCSGNLTVFHGGTLSLGTSGTPFSGNVEIMFDTVSSGNFGISTRNLSTVSLYGSPRTAGKAFVITSLTALAAATDTTLNVADDTGWLSGDKIVVTATRTNGTQSEERTLNANAGTNSMVVTSGLTNNHDGLDSTAVARVMLMTQNVKISNNASTSQRGDIQVTDCIWDVKYCLFDGMTVNYNATFTTASTMQFSSFRKNTNDNVVAFDGTAASNYTIHDLVFAEEQAV